MNSNHSGVVIHSESGASGDNIMTTAISALLQFVGMSLGELV